MFNVDMFHGSALRPAERFMVVLCRIRSSSGALDAERMFFELITYYYRFCFICIKKFFTSLRLFMICSFWSGVLSLLSC